MATDKKHTPGPWHAYDRGIGWEVHEGAQCCANECRCINDEFRETFTESDARLIAAAPELLEACEKLVNQGFCPSCGCNLANTPGCHYCVIVTLARKAVDKAEGRS